MKPINNRNACTHKKKVRGLALLEILIAIGILGLISAGVATLASRTFEEQSANEINKDLTDLSVSIQSAFKRSGGYPKFTEDTAQGLVDAFVISENVATNPENGDFYGISNAIQVTGGSNDAAFAIEVANLSPSLCTKLVTGPLLDGAKFLQASSTPTEGDVDLSKAIDKDTVIKSNGEIAPEVKDPLTAGDFCTDPVNVITAGYY